MFKACLHCSDINWRQFNWALFAVLILINILERSSREIQKLNFRQLFQFVFVQFLIITFNKITASNVYDNYV